MVEFYVQKEVDFLKKIKKKLEEFRNVCFLEVNCDEDLGIPLSSFNINVFLVFVVKPDKNITEALL